jgi:hypothetical protein
VAQRLVEVARVERCVDRVLAEEEVVVRDGAGLQQRLAAREKVATLGVARREAGLRAEHHRAGEAGTDVLEHRPRLVESRAGEIPVAVPAPARPRW